MKPWAKWRVELIMVVEPDGKDEATSEEPNVFVGASLVEVDP